jgi:hypothetical protein
MIPSQARRHSAPLHNEELNEFRNELSVLPARVSIMLSDGGAWAKTVSQKPRVITGKKKPGNCCKEKIWFHFFGFINYDCSLANDVLLLSGNLQLWKIVQPDFAVARFFFDPEFFPC